MDGEQEARPAAVEINTLRSWLENKTEQYEQALERAISAEAEAASLRTQVEELTEALGECAKDYEYLVGMIAANDPRRIDNGTQHRQNGILADVIATAGQGSGRVRALLARIEADTEAPA